MCARSTSRLCGKPIESHIRYRDILYTGELLTLPERDQKPPAGLTTYTVVKGDSWYRIAQDHNLTFRDVRAFNPELWLKRHIIIHPGDVMMLPWLGASDAGMIIDTARCRQRWINQQWINQPWTTSSGTTSSGTTSGGSTSGGSTGSGSTSGGTTGSDGRQRLPSGSDCFWPRLHDGWIATSRQCHAL